jgi:hypothetical protein
MYQIISLFILLKLILLKKIEKNKVLIYLN